MCGSYWFLEAMFKYVLIMVEKLLERKLEYIMLTVSSAVLDRNGIAWVKDTL